MARILPSARAPTCRGAARHGREGGTSRGATRAASDTGRRRPPPAGERYLLLADISGYTGFMAGVEEAHGVDFSGGIPAAYGVLGALLDSIVVGLSPDLGVVKLEGDAVFAAAPAAALDAQGAPIIARSEERRVGKECR